MAGYAKIWTAIFNDPWFLGLSVTARGVWLQLLVWAKMVGDTGSVSARSWTALGSAWGCDGKTVKKILGKFHENGKVQITEMGSRWGHDGVTAGSRRGHGGDKARKIPRDVPGDEKMGLRELDTPGVVIGVCNYQFYQRVTAKELVGGERPKPGKFPENSRKIPSLTIPDQSIPNQSILLTRQDKKSQPSKLKQTKNRRVSTTNPNHKPAVEYWCDQYEKIIGFKYDFISRDAKHISDLLKVFTFDQYRYLVDYILTTDDEWIADGRRTLGILYSIRNQVVQRIKAGPSKIPKRSRDNITTITEYLDRRKADDERAGQKQISGGAKPTELDLSEKPTGNSD